MIRLVIVLAAFVLGACETAPQPDQAHGAAPIRPEQALVSEVRIMGPSGVAVRIGAAEFAAMPHIAVNADFHGEKHVFEGVPLTSLVARAGAPTGDQLRGSELKHVVVVTSRDGYQVVLSLAETDPAISPRRVILADRADGAVIGGEDGPFRLVVEGDLKPARSARMVTSIEIRKLD